MISAEFIAAHKRRRILDAFAELCARHGYANASMSELSRHAAVARKTIYDNFEGKEEILLAAFDVARDEALARVAAAVAEAGEGVRARVEAGLAAFLGYVAERPDLARLCMVEALSATAASHQRYEEARQAFGELAHTVVFAKGSSPTPIEESLLGGATWIVYQKIRHGEAESAPDLLPELTDFLLAPARLPAASPSG